MSNKREIKAELQMDLPALTSYLEALIAGLKEGKVYLEHEGKVVGLCPGHSVEVTLEAKQKSDKEKLTIEMEWRRAQTFVAASTELKISANKGEDS